MLQGKNNKLQHFMWSLLMVFVMPFQLYKHYYGHDYKYPLNQKMGCNFMIQTRYNLDWDEMCMYIHWIISVFRKIANEQDIDFWFKMSKILIISYMYNLQYTVHTANHELTLNFLYYWNYNSLAERLTSVNKNSGKKW